MDEYTDTEGACERRLLGGRVVGGGGNVGTPLDMDLTGIVNRSLSNSGGDVDMILSHLMVRWPL